MIFLYFSFVEKSLGSLESVGSLGSGERNFLPKLSDEPE
jgi:hypothetical protein